MSTCSRWLATAGLAFVAFIAAGCGSDTASVAGPSGPQAPRTATIVGQVNGAAAASASVQSASSRSGIRVTVVGTSLSATTDSSGHFTLSGIPTGDGSVALRFEGHGIDATLEISGLTPGQTLQISVQLSGNHASLDDQGEDDDDQDEVEFTGHVDSIGASSLVVGGRTVFVDASTKIKDGDHTIELSSLTVGMLVEVDGLLQSDGSTLAKKIKVENGEESDGESDDAGDDD